MSDHAIPVPAETTRDEFRANPADGPVQPGLPGLLASLRQRGGLSQNALARLANVSPSTVNNLESGQRHPTRELSLRIARSMGLAPAETDELLVAARHAPDLTDRISPTDPDLRLVVAILTDDSLPRDRREHFRALIRHAAAFAGCRAEAEVAE